MHSPPSVLSVLLLLVCASKFLGVYGNNGTQDKFITPCTTPNGEDAFCIEINRCPIFLKALENLQHQDASTYQFLRQSRCGPSNEDKTLPRVCCGKVANFTRTDYTPPLDFEAPAYEQAVTTETPVGFPQTCGVQDMVLSSRIFGGREAELGEFPWMVRMVHINQKGVRTYGCSGFLVHARFVITAAHCVVSDSLLFVGPIKEVQIGEHNTRTDPDCVDIFGTSVCAPPVQLIRVSNKTYHHPKYDKHSLNRYNDIAVIPLKAEVLFNRFVQPICLLKNRAANMTHLWLSGWGVTENAEVSTIKRKVVVPVSDFNECAEKYRKQNVELSTLMHICAGGVDRKDSCAGDSGGPAMYFDGKTWYAAGVVSFGVGCGQDGWPGIYTNLTNYVEWIEGTVLRRLHRDRRRTVL